MKAPTGLWQSRLKEALGQRIHGRIFSGFNVNVDVIVHLTKETVARLVDDPEVSMEEVRKRSILDIASIQSKVDLLAVLIDRLGKGKSFHIIVDNPDLLQWLDKQFSGELESMGGQAGIISNQMAMIGAASVVYTPLLSEKQARLFHEAILTPVVDDGRLNLVPTNRAVRQDTGTKINWIMEYFKDRELVFGDMTIVPPRANRVILATRPKESVMAFDAQLMPHLAELGKKIDVAFMAGYHYASPIGPDGRTFDEYMAYTLESLRALKSANPKLRLHFEYVPMQFEELETAVLEGIADEIQSFGINENEIKRVLKVFGFEDEYRAVLERERAYSLYKGALALMERLGFERIQVHNLGYYVLVLKKPYPVPFERVRQACLFASGVNAIKAKYGGYVTRNRLGEAGEIQLSPIGFEQLEGLAAELQAEGIDPRPLLNDGVVEFDDHYLMVIPAHVVPDPVSTVGMGDTISSSSYAMEYYDDVMEPAPSAPRAGSSGHS